MGKYYVGYFPVIGKLCNRLEIPRKHRNGVGNSRTSGKQDPTSLIQFLRKKKGFAALEISADFVPRKLPINRKNFIDILRRF